ncbi:tRNA pseudouridine synthase 4 [Exophiala dermatitidis]
MAQPSGKVLEGVFAVHKPPNLSSAQVLRDLQHKFAESKTFEPLLQRTKNALEEQGRHQPKRRKRGNDQIFKMGHGGTLDPMATGILIVGIGRGTKFLQDFLGCKKTYETVVLFGKSTDTYDTTGKVVAEAPTDHITKDLVEEKIEKFRGKQKQMPPLFSAIKINGMKAYEYARTGKELPRELETREVEVSECTLLDFYLPGEHDFRWPAEQAPEEAKALARKLLPGAQSSQQEPDAQSSQAADTSTERPKDETTVDQTKDVKINEIPYEKKAAMHVHTATQEDVPAQAPAARVRLTVSSGFYVRSFAYDLGIACDSYGSMASLVRSQQGSYSTSQPPPEGFLPTLTYEDLEAGEDVWGPKVSSVLEQWVEEHPESTTQNDFDHRDSPRGQKTFRGGKGYRGRGGGNKRFWNERKGNGSQGRRRNSSSPES